MLLIKIAVLAIVTCVFSLCIKKDQPAFAALIALCGTICLLSMATEKMVPFFQWIKRLAQYTQSQNLSCLLQVLGIAVVSQFAADTCKDSGLSSAASAVELCGRLLALLQAMPLLQQLVDAFFSFLR